jgi:DivIVA domain-containing protein
MTRRKLTPSWMRSASGWPRWRRPTGQKGPLENGEILAGWAAWADSTTFSSRRRRDGYDKAEVDAFVDFVALSYGIRVRKPAAVTRQGHRVARRRTAYPLPGLNPHQVGMQLRQEPLQVVPAEFHAM